MLTKETKVDQITVTENGIILIRETTVVLEDSVELSRQYHRMPLTPGSDVSNQPQNVQDICAVVWTPEVIQEYNNSIKDERTTA